jgi:hypothetical protein
MTTTAITTTAPQGMNAPTKYKEEEIQQEIQILKAAFPKLEAGADQMRALIIAAKYSGLNPFKGEIYYVKNVGIMVSSKIKASDAITWQQRNGNTLNITFDKINPGIIKNRPETLGQYAELVAEGDVAYVCKIISSKQRRDYFEFRNQLITEGRMFGYSHQELENWVTAKAGPMPEIRALGVVKRAENFGGDAKYSRDDRAQKRALQLALNIGGYAAPDARNYGGVAIGDERPNGDQVIDGDYSIGMPSDAIPTTPSIIINGEPEEPEAPEDEAPAQPSPERQQVAQKAMRNHGDLKSEEPFGNDPKPATTVTAPINTLPGLSSYIEAKGDTLTIAEWRTTNARAVMLAKAAGRKDLVGAHDVPKDVNTMRELKDHTVEIIKALWADDSIAVVPA